MYVLELAGEDDAFAVAEAANAAENVTVIAPGLATATAVDPDAFVHLAFARRASDLVARTTGTVDAAENALRETPFDRSGSVAVRARDVRGTADVDTQAAEIALGSVLAGAGFDVDLETPDHELLALFAEDTCVLGWGIVESERTYGNRAPTERPFFQPGSMDPLLARAVVNLAGVRAEETVLDPMCGTGGLLLEAGLVGGRLVGFDAQERMVRGTQRNLRAYLDVDPVLGIADATALPIRTDSVDAVVFDAPYGRQSKIATHTLEDLVTGALSEAERVGERAVLVADRDWREAAEAAGWTVTSLFERRVHRSLDRYVHVLR